MGFRLEWEGMGFTFVVEANDEFVRVRQRDGLEVDDQLFLNLEELDRVIDALQKARDSFKKGK